MDIERKGLTISVDVGIESDQWLLDAAAEIRVAAEARGLEIPAFAGGTAVQETVEVVETTSEFIPETAETLKTQLPSAIRGYQAVMGSLNEGKRKSNKVETATEEDLQTELDVWLTPERLDTVNAIKEAQPEVSFTLVATPNVPMSAGDIKKVAERFGRNQPYSTYTWDDLYNRYTAGQLSGTDDFGTDAFTPVHFSLIPSELTPELANKTVKEQRTALAELQAEHPSLTVPSVLDAVTYWETLRQSGPVSGNGTSDKTDIRHFDLEEQSVGGWLRVPFSFVYDGGEAFLDGARAGGRGDARVAVG